MKLRRQNVLLYGIVICLGVGAIWYQYRDAFVSAGLGEKVSLQDYYFETAKPTLSGERRLVVNLKGGAVDFAVLIHGDNRGFPRFVGGRSGTERAKGEILVTSYDDRIELTGTGNVFQISNGEVLQEPFPYRLTARDLPDVWAGLGDDFTMAKLKSVVSEIEAN